MNKQKTTFTQNKLFNLLNRLSFKYRFFIISSNALKISSLGIFIISLFLFLTLFIPKLQTLISIMIIFIVSISILTLIIITIPKILRNKVINTIDQLLKGEHRFITAWELRNTKHDLANVQAQNAILFLKKFKADSKIRLFPQTLTIVFFTLSLASLLTFFFWDTPSNTPNSLRNQSTNPEEINNQINTTPLQDLLNAIEKNNPTSLTPPNSADGILKETIDKLDQATSERETIKSISEAIESLEKIEQTTLNKNKFEELTSQINNEQLNEILTKLQSNSLNYEAKKNLLKEQIQQWPDTTLKSNFKPNNESSSLDATTTLFENILSMLNKDNKNISNDSIENILKEIEKMTSENIQENTRESLEILQLLRENLLGINQSELKNEKTVSTSKAGNQLGINNKKITQSPEKISAPKGDTLIIQNKTIDNNMATTSYTSQETSNTSKQILNTQTPQIKKTYEKQARMYIKKHSIPDKYHNLILEYFMRLSEKSS